MLFKLALDETSAVIKISIATMSFALGLHTGVGHIALCGIFVDLEQKIEELLGNF